MKEYVGLHQARQTQKRSMWRKGVRQFGDGVFGGEVGDVKVNQSDRNE